MKRLVEDDGFLGNKNDTSKQLKGKPKSEKINGEA